jgi:hypothetical protein
VARHQGAPGIKPDDLDLAFAAVVTARVIVQPLQAASVHEALQAWCAGLLEADWAAAVAPDGNGVLEQWLAPGAGERAWREAWLSVLQTETRWAWANQVANALRRTDQLPPLPKTMTDGERKIICATVAGNGRADRVIEVQPGARGAACPCCNIMLPDGQRHRLMGERFATAECCGRVLLNTELRP